MFPPQELADRTGEGTATVYRDVRMSKLPAEKFAGEWVITRADLKESLPSALYRKHLGPKEEA